MNLAFLRFPLSTDPEGRLLQSRHSELVVREMRLDTTRVSDERLLSQMHTFTGLKTVTIYDDYKNKLYVDVDFHNHCSRNLFSVLDALSCPQLENLVLYDFNWDELYSDLPAALNAFPKLKSLYLRWEPEDPFFFLGFYRLPIKLVWNSLIALMNKEVYFFLRPARSPGLHWLLCPAILRHAREQKFDPRPLIQWLSLSWLRIRGLLGLQCDVAILELEDIVDEDDLLMVLETITSLISSHKINRPLDATIFLNCQFSPRCSLIVDSMPTTITNLNITIPNAQQITPSLFIKIVSVLPNLSHLKFMLCAGLEDLEIDGKYPVLTDEFGRRLVEEKLWLTRGTEASYLLYINENQELTVELLRLFDVGSSLLSIKVELIN
jgi:hypothetical protein